MRMAHRAEQILQLLMDAPIVTVEPGLMVESRTSSGVHGDGDDLAFSVEWRDDEDRLWAADFLEADLERARIAGGTVSLRDFEGAEVVFLLFMPAKQIKLPVLSKR
jgi:hypothetical protein